MSRIQNELDCSVPKRNSMPAAPPSEVTSIRPRWRSAALSASQTQNDSVDPSGAVTSMMTAENPSGTTVDELADDWGAGAGGNAGVLDSSSPGAPLQPARRTPMAAARSQPTG